MPETGRLEGRVKTGGVAPFGAVISRDGRVGLGQQLGRPLAEGRRPDAADRHWSRPPIASSSTSAASPSTGTIARIDLETRGR